MEQIRPAGRISMLRQVLRRHAWSMPVALVVSSWTLASGANESSRPDSINVICPALEIDDRPRSNWIVETAQRPDLVVLGTAKKVNTDQGCDSYQVTIEKTLYGDWVRDALHFTAPYTGLEGRQIFSLARSSREGDSALRFRSALPPVEEKAVAAVCAARLEYNVLTAQCIFVGKESKPARGFVHTVEVVRTLAGPPLREGQSVRVVIEGSWPGEKPEVNSSPAIYFISTIEYGTRETSPAYKLASRQPAKLEEQVKTTLARRKDFPVYERADGGRRVKFLEVTLRGTTADAIDLLGSASDAAVSLGFRYLMHQRSRTRADVIAAIKTDLFRFAREKPGDFRKLRELISVLGSMEREEAKGDLGKLVEQYIAHVAGHPTHPPEIKREEPWRSHGRFEDQLTEFNHGLAWLLTEMSSSDLQKSHSARLLQLRDGTKGRWKTEVQLALDAGRVEDTIELDNALTRMKDVKPVRSKAEMHLSGFYVLAFSHDGKHLATAGNGSVQVWNVENWSVTAHFPLDGSIEQVRFSPDDRLLYIAGGGPGLQIHARYDWRTGTVDKEFRGHQKGLCELELSDDGSVMATASFYEGKVHVWDTTAGRIRKSFLMNGLNHRLILSPSGKTLIRLGDNDRWVADSFGDVHSALPSLSKDCGLAFAPDGKYLVTAEPQVAENRANAWKPAKAPVAIQLRDVSRAFKEVALHTDVRFGDSVFVAPDGKRLVLHDAGPPGGPSRNAVGEPAVVAFTVLSLPRLEQISQFRIFDPDRIDLQSLAFSPDGKVLAVATAQRNPYLFNTDTGKPILPVAGHADRIKSLHFLPGNKSLRTIGDDNSVCLWDVATMKLLERISLPPECEIKAVREPDGRYVICYVPGPKGKQPTKVFDTSTGKMVSEVTLPRRDIWKGDVQWLNETEAEQVIFQSHCVFDCMTGRIVREFETERCEDGYPNPDGKALFIIDGDGFHLPEGSLCRVDTVAGKKTELGKFQLQHATGNSRGLVPGGKYFYVADPGMYVFDRQTFQLVAAHAFRGTDLLSHSFSADGSRYAVATGGRIFIGEELRQHDPHTSSVIRVVETLSAKTQLAFFASTRWVRVKLAPDASRLAVVNDDNTIEMWKMPPAQEPGRDSASRRSVSPGN
jgi:WD40 repeat protein